MARVFGLFAILFGSFYLSEGASWLHRFASGATSRELFWSHYQTAVIFFDFFIGGGSAAAGVGMILRMDWGRRAWLVLLATAVTLHLLMTLVNYAVGFDVRGSYGWVLMVVVSAVVSWVWLTRTGARARFR
ncbi:MAG: hypothetical protein ABW250_22630 [Pyrinomonadaceae bacterium]